jgi:meckelin
LYFSNPKKILFVFLAIIQYLVYVVFYQRFVEDKLLNFIDLCSVSNISVLLLIDNRYGYYIHGRSPHGTTDVNMKDMLINLERESNRMSGTRGLEAKSDDQTFIIKIDGAFRSQYDLLIQTYRVNEYLIK